MAGVVEDQIDDDDEEDDDADHDASDGAAGEIVVGVCGSDGCHFAI